MSKIKITESELKQLIGESVISVLNEARYNTYGVNWEDLTEPQKKKYAEMYGNKAKAGQYVDASGNPYTGGGNVPGSGYTFQYDMNKMRDFYNQEQKKFAKNSRRNGITPEFYQQVVQQKNQLNAQLKQAQNLNKGYNDAIQQIANALKVQLAEAVGSVPSYDASIPGTGAVAVPTPEQNAEMLVKSAVPQLPQILKAIETLKGRVAQLNKKNTTLTAQNKSLTTRIKNSQMVAQGPQSTTIPTINQPQVTAPTRPATLARPKAAAPGNAQV